MPKRGLQKQPKEIIGRQKNHDPEKITEEIIQNTTQIQNEETYTKATNPQLSADVQEKLILVLLAPDKTLQV